MIEVRGLIKEYDKKLKAVDDISFTAAQGEITIILGPNGAGKSTALKSIAGLLNFKGSITICGQPNKSLEAKRLLGYVPELPALYDLLTVWEHLKFIAGAYRLADGWQVYADSLLKRLEIYDKKDKLARELSKGMTQKLSIALALIVRPSAVIFDEPLVGLDPRAIEEVISMFEELKGQGVSVLISTHIIDTVEELWDRALIMKNGKILREVSRNQMDGSSLKELFFALTGGDEV